MSKKRKAEDNSPLPDDYLEELALPPPYSESLPTVFVLPPPPPPPVVQQVPVVAQAAVVPKPKEEEYTVVFTSVPQFLGNEKFKEIGLKFSEDLMLAFMVNNTYTYSHWKAVALSLADKWYPGTKFDFTILFSKQSFIDYSFCTKNSPYMIILNMSLTHLKTGSVHRCFLTLMANHYGNKKRK